MKQTHAKKKINAFHGREEKRKKVMPPVKLFSDKDCMKIHQPMASLLVKGKVKDIQLENPADYRYGQVVFVFALEATAESVEKPNHNESLYSVYINALNTGNLEVGNMPANKYIGYVKIGKKIKYDHYEILASRKFLEPLNTMPYSLKLCEIDYSSHERIRVEERTIKVPLCDTAWNDLCHFSGSIYFYWEQDFSIFYSSEYGFGDINGLYDILFYNKGNKKLCIQKNSNAIRKEVHLSKVNKKTFETLVFHFDEISPKLKYTGSFEILQKKNWILDWNCVKFKAGYIVVVPPVDGSVKFKPKAVQLVGAMESFNYLKDYLNDRLQPVHCSVENMSLSIYDTIRLNEAIVKFEVASQQRAIKITETTSISKIAPQQMPFKQALSKTQEMTPEEFKKYKSKYIDYLVSLQSKIYKIIPCVERLAHANNDSTEYAFLFSIECSSGKILIVHENVNPDRSTLLFLIEKNSYDRSIMSIYDFLQSAEINKRSNIRERSISYHDGIIDYKSINHDDLSSWKRAIEWYFKIAINIPRKRIDITKMKFTSFNQLLKGIQADDNYKEVQPILEKYGIPTNRKLKPADILERIPNSICTIDKDGRKILPIPNGQWTLEKIIKLIKYC